MPFPVPFLSRAASTRFALCPAAREPSAREPSDEEPLEAQVPAGQIQNGELIARACALLAHPGIRIGTGVRGLVARGRLLGAYAGHATRNRVLLAFGGAQSAERGIKGAPPSAPGRLARGRERWRVLAVEARGHLVERLLRMPVHGAPFGAGGFTCLCARMRIQKYI